MIPVILNPLSYKYLIISLQNSPLEEAIKYFLSGSFLVIDSIIGSYVLLLVKSFFLKLVILNTVLTLPQSIFWL